jgi:hypothetical protein
LSDSEEHYNIKHQVGLNDPSQWGRKPATSIPVQAKSPRITAPPAASSSDGWERKALSEEPLSNPMVDIDVTTL